MHIDRYLVSIRSESRTTQQPHTHPRSTYNPQSPTGEEKSLCEGKGGKTFRAWQGAWFSLLAVPWAGMLGVMDGIYLGRRMGGNEQVKGQGEGMG